MFGASILRDRSDQLLDPSNGNQVHSRAPERHDLAGHGERHALQPRPCRGCGVQDGGKLRSPRGCSWPGCSTDFRRAEPLPMSAEGATTMEVDRTPCAASVQNLLGPVVYIVDTFAVSSTVIDGNPRTLQRHRQVAHPPRLAAGEHADRRECPSGDIASRHSAGACSSRPSSTPARSGSPQQSFSPSPISLCTPGIQDSTHALADRPAARGRALQRLSSRPAPRISSARTERARCVSRAISSPPDPVSGNAADLRSDIQAQGRARDVD